MRARAPSTVSRPATSGPGGDPSSSRVSSGLVALIALTLAALVAALMGASRGPRPAELAETCTPSSGDLIDEEVRTPQVEEPVATDPPSPSPPPPTTMVVRDAPVCDEVRPVAEVVETTPTPTFVAPPPPVALVGDSITFEHIAVYADLLTECCAADVVIDARSGRMITTTDGNPFGPIPSGFATVELIERTMDPSVWLIELGVNDVNLGVFDDGGMRSAITDVLDLLDPDDAVYWVGTWTVGPRSDLAAEFTASLEAEERITVVDWPDVAAGLVYDGLHPTPEGAAHLASMYCACLG